jgi:hypothetical protein
MSKRRERSLRAQARVRYCETREEGARERAPKKSPHPARKARHPLPAKGRLRPSSTGYAGEGKKEPASRARVADGGETGRGNEQDLTAQARALYEESVVPVAEIARLCGVSERTIYKYVQKGNWKPRYRWIAGEAGARHRRWQAPPTFAPARGAGARFVCRAEKGQPFAVGLKATDPVAAAQAAAACEEARVVATRAAAQAKLAQRREAEIENVAAVGVAVAEILKNERRYAARGNTTRPGEDALAHALWITAAFALSRWEAALRG